MWISKEEDDEPRPTMGVRPRWSRNCFQASKFEAPAEFVESALVAFSGQRGSEMQRSYGFLTLALTLFLVFTIL